MNQVILVVFVSMSTICEYFLLNFLAFFSQRQFIQLCKTLYDIFHELPEEQELYHALATVGTLLLQIGEVGKRFSTSSSQSVPSPDVEVASPVGSQGSEGDRSADALSKLSLESSTENQDVNSSRDSSDTVNKEKKPSGAEVDSAWSISFEQYLASMLTEPALVKYFEQRVDLTPVIEKFRNRRLYSRSESTTNSPTASI